MFDMRRRKFLTLFGGAAARGARAAASDAGDRRARQAPRSSSEARSR